MAQIVSLISGKGGTGKTSLCAGIAACLARDGFRVLKTIAVLFKDYRPLLVFWSLACLLTVVSLGLFLPVLDEYMSSGLVPRFPTLIVSGFCMLAALLSFVSGLILDCQRKRARQAFEIQLNVLSLLLRQGRAAMPSGGDRPEQA